MTAAQQAEYHACQERAGRATHEQRSKFVALSGVGFCFFDRLAVVRDRLTALRREAQLASEMQASRTTQIDELKALLEQKNDAVAQLSARRDKLEAFVAEQQTKQVARCASALVVRFV